jgi:hypothetical protein
MAPGPLELNVMYLDTIGRSRAITAYLGPRSYQLTPRSFTTNHGDTSHSIEATWRGEPVRVSHPAPAAA